MEFSIHKGHDENPYRWRIRQVTGKRRRSVNDHDEGQQRGASRMREDQANRNASSSSTTIVQNYTQAIPQKSKYHSDTPISDKLKVTDRNNREQSDISTKCVNQVISQKGDEERAFAPAPVTNTFVDACRTSRIVDITDNADALNSPSSVSLSSSVLDTVPSGVTIKTDGAVVGGDLSPSKEEIPSNCAPDQLNKLRKYFKT